MTIDCAGAVESGDENEVTDEFDDAAMETRTYVYPDKTFVTQYPESPDSDRNLTTPEMPSTASPKKQTREALLVVNSPSAMLKNAVFYCYTCTVKFSSF